ncbi:fumarylacetoacetate hydrolase family protein [Streptomyces phaeofaciens]|nr:fumarylacetoacetate hydrolase family protein [Streptomyces phaeofaciens]
MMRNAFEVATVQADTGPATALVTEGRTWLLSDLDEALTDVSVLELLGQWDRTLPRLQGLADRVSAGRVGACTPLKEPRLLTPVRYPSKLLAVGANYVGHLREMGLEPTKWTPMPFFLRPPRTTLVGPGRTVPVPTGTQQFDWECELAVVLGRGLRNATRAEAAAAVAGYTIGLDLTCRDLIKVDNELHVDLMRGKAQDCMAPCGPTITPARFVEDVGDLRIQLSVNGEPMMDASTEEMLFAIDEQLSLISEVMTLEPGDILFTGSPAGSAGEHGGRWLRPGDTIHARIGGLAPLDVTVF